MTLAATRPTRQLLDELTALANLADEELTEVRERMDELSQRLHHLRAAVGLVQRRVLSTEEK
jgi:hypothetical protein